MPRGGGCQELGSFPLNGYGTADACATREGAVGGTDTSGATVTAHLRQVGRCDQPNNTFHFELIAACRKITTWQPCSSAHALGQLLFEFEVPEGSEGELRATITTMAEIFSVFGYHESLFTLYSALPEGSYTPATNVLSAGSPDGTNFWIRLSPGVNRLSVGMHIYQVANVVGGADLADGIHYTASVTFSNLTIEPGALQRDPRMPDGEQDPDGGWSFPPRPPGPPWWYDPPWADGYEFAASASSAFARVAAFPDGLGEKFHVIAEGQDLGWFPYTESVDFVSHLGHGATNFTIQGIHPTVDATNPAAFPVMLGFATDANDFTMKPLLADPHFRGIGVLSNNINLVVANVPSNSAVLVTSSSNMTSELFSEIGFITNSSQIADFPLTLLATSPASFYRIESPQ